MARSHRYGTWILVTSVTLLLAGIVIIPQNLLAERSLSPEQAVQRAWRLAQESGAYHFSTDIVQTTYPAPAVANVGRSSRQETLYIEGQTNLPERTLSMTLWKGGSVLSPRDGIEVRVEGDRAYGRQIGGAWQEMEDFSGAFAPGSDLMAYLAGAKNVRQVGESAEHALRFTHYAFDVDGPAFARYVRDQLERHLIENGELPRGVNLEVARQYSDVNGQGEVWIDGDNLPMRLKVHLEYPEQSNGERVKADIQTDFSGFVREVLTQAPSLSEDPMTWFVGALGLPRAPHDWQNLGLRAGLALGLMGLVLLLATSRRSKKVYTAFALVIIFSTVVSPLLESQQVFAFFERQVARRAESEQRQQEEQATREAQEKLATHWNPNVEPALQHQMRQATGEPLPSVQPFPASNVRVAAEDDEGGSKDGDDDGLTDWQEENLSTSSTNPDSDGDGLDDGTEFLRLGTIPTESDSDSDGIPDKKEVEGFFYYQQWYLDPNNADTNEDGLPDMLECPEFVAYSSASGTYCQDTDKDHVPDVFSFDNDGDGVPDRTDLSPFSRLPGQSSSFGRTNPFLLAVSGLKKNTPAFVDLQLRPQNPDHLAYAMSVLDWPTGDVDGQIQRILDTTFADSLTSEQQAADPASANGDMRLIPMVEIQMTGSNIPLALTDAQATVEIGAPFDGTIEMTQQGTKIDVAFTFSDAQASYDVGIYAGTCPATGQAKLSWTGISDGASRTPSKYLTKLANGDHVVAVSDGDETVCVPLPNLVNGPYLKKMVDPKPLAPYGVTVREQDDAGDLLAYVPLNVVMDETGGSQVAFSARMPYQANKSSWGNAHQVRLVWLVQMLVDFCADPTDDQLDCSDTANRQEYAQIVHAYYDDWTLTGLSVREDHGLQVAIAFEDPDNDKDTNSDDYLWRLAYGLENVFVGGRGTDTDGDGEPDTRDMTVADIKSTFDITSTAPVSPTRWNIPTDAIRVALLPAFPNQDYLAHIPMTYTKQILFDYFTDASDQPKADAPTLLFAREEHSRVANLDLKGDGIIQTAKVGGARADNQVTVYFAQAGAPEKTLPVETLCAINLAPYRFRDGAWESYPLEEYWDRLGARLRKIFEADPEFYDPDDPDREWAVDGAAAIAQSFYLSLVQGSSRKVGETKQGQTILFEQSYVPDEDLSQLWRSYGGAVKAVSAVVALEFIIAYRYYQAWINARPQDAGIRWFFVTLGQSLRGKLPGTLYTTPIAYTLKNFISQNIGKVGVLLSIGVGLAVGLIIVWAALKVSGISITRYIFATLKLGISVIAFCLTVKGIVGVGAMGGGASALFSMEGVNRLWTQAQKSYKAGIIGLIIGVAVMFGFFVYSVISSGVDLMSMAFRGMVAYFIANVILAVILFAISLIPIVGQLIAAIITLIDALISFVCSVVPEEKLKETKGGQWFCKGISGIMAEGIKWGIYSSTILVDLRDTDRLQVFNFDQGFATPGDVEKGIAVGSRLSFSLGVTSTIRLTKVIPDWETVVEDWENGEGLIPVDWKSVAYGYQFNNNTLKTSTFEYRLQNSQQDYHEWLDRKTMTGEWTSVEDDVGNFEVADFYTNQTAQTDTPALTNAGINRKIPLYLSEGYAVPAQECYAVPIPPWTPPIPFITLQPVCTIQTSRAGNHNDLDLRYDVFPATLDGFLELTAKNGGFSLAWGQSTAITSTALGGAPLTFPRQKDADGDGLLNPADGGPDPDDSEWDSDFDRLADAYERGHGSDPTRSDTDGDRLGDYDEFRVGTSPSRIDTDNDGLTDAQEVNGWEYVYGLDIWGAQRITWVTSDPLIPDTDGDGLTDFREKVFGFHPRVPSSPNVLTFVSEVYERSAPRLLLHLEEEPGATTFNDDSGYGNHAACTGDRCPTVGAVSQEGYGLALQFDGVNDRVASTDFAIADDFTLSLWINPAKTDDGQAFIGKHTSTGDDILVFGFYDGGYHVNLRGSTYQVGTKATGWQHLAVVGQSLTGAMTRVSVYKDGHRLGRQTLNVVLGDTSGKNWALGQEWDGNTASDFFEGLMDEVAVFDRALSQAEIKLLASSDGPFDHNDLVVQQGAVLDYQAHLKNELLDRYAQGLLSTELPEMITGDVDPVAFVLPPTEQAVISGSLKVSSAADSGQLELTQKAGAVIADWRDLANQANLWLRMDEPSDATTFLDYSGSLPPRDATCGNHCPDRQQAGMFNYGLKFDTGQYLTLKNARTLGLKGGSFSVSVWVKGTDYDVFQRTILGTNDTGSHRIYIFDNKPTIAFGGGQTDTGDFRLSTGKWYHLVFCYDHTNHKRSIYVNGGLKGSSSGGSQFQTQMEGNVLLGRSWKGNYFKGYMDDLRIFKRALTAEEIRHLFAYPVLAMDFEPTGQTRIFNDQSGFGNRGTAYINDNNNSNSCSSSKTSGCPTRKSGVSGKAVQFNGQNYISIGSSGSLNLSWGQFTLAAWVYPTSSGDTTKDQYPQGILGKDSGKSDAYPSLQAIDRKVRVGFGVSGVGWGDTSCTTGDVLTRGDWNHVVATYQTFASVEGGTEDRGMFTIYVNGVEEKTCTLADAYTPRSDVTDLTIGRSSHQGSVYLDRFEVIDEADGPGDAEIYLEWEGERICENSTELVIGRGCRYADLEDGSVVTLHASRSFANAGTLEAWEDDDSADDDDDLGKYVFSANDPGFQTKTLDWIGDRSDGFEDATDIDFYLGRSGHPAYTHDSIPFHGRVDDVLIYKQALDAAAVDELYRTGTNDLHLRFDEPPGSTRFANSVGPDSTNGGCVVGTSGFVGGSCPTSGVAGRVNQAVLFDGNDYVEAEVDVPENAYAASLWFQTECADCGIFSADKGTLGSGGHDRDIYLDGGNLCAYVSIGKTICTSGANFADGRWHHVVHTFGGDAGGQKLYVDGALRGSGYKSSSDFSAQTGVNVGHSREADDPYFVGRIDDVRIVKGAQTADQVEELYQSAPVFLMHLDEPHSTAGVTTTTFLDGAGANDGTCGGGDPDSTACPATSVKGQLGLAAEFDGVDDHITIPDDDALDFYDLYGDFFSVGAWVMPTEVPAHYQTIIVKGNEEEGRNYSLRLLPYSTHVEFAFDQEDSMGECTIDFHRHSNGTLLLNQWNHVVMTFAGSPVYEMNLYINGILDKSVNTGMINWMCQNDNPLQIGGEASPYTQFNGRIDEAFLYHRALSEFEVLEMFLYQGKWIEERQNHLVTVDEDAPVSFLRSYTPTLPYWPNRDVQMLVEAHDPTSVVGAAELGAMKDGQTETTWELAPRCQDVEGDAAWCPTFDPGLFGGEGTYTLQTRATDLTGHAETPTRTYTLYVDGSPPTLATSLTDGARLDGSSQTADPNGWTVRVSGTAQDPSLSSGDAGSGVLTDSVRVTLLAPDGAPAGRGPQVAVVTGNGDATCRSQPCTWAVDYVFPEAQPTGVYTVHVQAADQVGNQQIADLVTVQVDATAPAASLDLASVPTTILTATTTLQGDGTERPVPVVVTWTTDGAGDETGVTIQCNGLTRYAAGVGTFAPQSATYAWSSMVHQGATCQADLLDDGENGGATGVVQVCGSQVASWDGSYGVDLAVPFTADSSACGPALAVAGVDQVEIAFAPTLPGSPFYNEMPLAGQVLHLPFEDHPDKNDNLHFLDVTGSGSSSCSGRGHTGRCYPESCPTVGEYGHIGSAARFDGEGDYVDLCRSSLNQLTNDFSVMAWVKPDRVTHEQQWLTGQPPMQWIIGSLQGASENGFGLGLHGEGLRFSTFGVRDYDTTGVEIIPQVWTHVAAVMGADNNVTFYVNGKAIETIPHSEPANPDTDDPLHIGMATLGSYPMLPFAGLLDDVRIFDRALAAAEIEAIYVGSGGPMLALPFDNAWAAGGARLADESGWSHQVTLHTTPLYGGTEDPANKAVPGQVGLHGLAFDGVDDYASVARNTGLDLSSGRFSLAAWVYPTPQNDGPYPILGSGAYTDTLHQYPFLQVVNRTQLNVGFGDGSQFTTYTTGDVLTENAWNHVVAAFDGSTCTIYVNGVERASTAQFAGMTPYPTHRLDVGRGTDADGAGACAVLTLKDMVPKGWFWQHRIKLNGEVVFATEPRFLFRDEQIPIEQLFYFCGTAQIEVEELVASLNWWRPWGTHTIDTTPGSGQHEFSTVTLSWEVSRDPADLNHFRGRLDDVRVYLHPLSEPEIQALYHSAWQTTALTPAGGAGVSLVDWSGAAPTGLEGSYRLDLRGWDVAGHADNTGQGAWHGDVDTLAPRVTLTRTTVRGKYQYTAVAQDYNLVKRGFRSPCGLEVVTAREYFQAPWYLGLSRRTSSTSQRLYQLTATCEVDPQTVAEVGAYDTPGAAYTVFLSNTYAYVADGGAGLRILDVSDPTAPVEVGFYDTPGTAYDVVVSGDYAYVADGSAGLCIINVSDPTAPTESGSLATLSPAFGVALLGTYAYVAEWNNGLEVVTVADPNDPLPVGNEFAPVPANSIAVSGAYAYVTAYDNGLYVEDVSIPQIPWNTGQEDTPGFAEHVAISGTYAYVGDGAAGLRVIDIQAPAAPDEVGFYDTPGYARGVAVTGNYACVADSFAGLQVLDISTPADPQLVRVYDTPGYARGVAISGDYAYVADGNRGLRIVDIFASATLDEEMTACDVAGNCATTAAITTTSRAALHAPVQEESLQVAILNVPSVLESTDLFSIAGDARAITSSLRALTVTVDSVPISTTTWAEGAVTETNWASDWTPPGDGTYTLQASVADWEGNTASDTVIVTVDTTPPAITIATLAFTSTHYHPPGTVDLSGLVTDTGGVESVQVTVWDATGLEVASEPGNVDGAAWSAGWYLGAGALPDGETYTVTAQATDVAGRAGWVTETVLVDVMPPASVVPTMVYTSDGGGGLVTPGMTIREAGPLTPTLLLAWTASSDGGGLGDYVVEGTVQTTDTQTAEPWEISQVSRTAWYTASDGQKVTVQLTSQDIYGNQTDQSFGPVYVDSPRTPNYVPLGDLYHGWMESGCSQVGTDRRINQSASDAAFLNTEQRFYATWNVEALRLAWTGANWDTNGDLFIYLDTEPGGTTTALNPYAAFTDTVIYLPGATPISPTSGMAADYLVWVQNSQQAALLHWDGGDWNFETVLLAGGDQYWFDPALNLGQTDLYLPFDLIGLPAGGGSDLDMVAFASEEGGLRLWAAMPNANPVNSAWVSEADVYAGSAQEFALTHSYHWDSLGSGVCPNGRDGSTPTPYLDTDVQVWISSEPEGAVYSFRDDDLFWLWELLLGDKPGDVSSLLTFLGSDQPLLGDGSEISYTFSYYNQGTYTATGVLADVSAHYGLRLPDGDTRDHQVVVLGDIGPDESGEVAFRGVIDVQEAYQYCVDTLMLADCTPYLRWAAVDAQIYDDSHPESGSPLERMWVDHAVDYSPPEFFGIERPEYLIAPGENWLHGYAYDNSGVATMTLEIQGAATLVCPDATPEDGRWSCTWDATGASDEDVLTVSLQAADVFGQVSAWSGGQSFLVDGTPPTVTLDLTATQVTSGSLVQVGAYALFGQVDDDRGLGGVEVCVNEACKPASVQLTGAATAHTYDDEPTDPISITSATVCGGGEIVHTITVNESFAIGRVDVGFNAEHDHRDDLQVELESPTGTRVRLLYDDAITGTNFANYDVLLSDPALSRYNTGPDDNPDEPYYDRTARPYAPLRAFIGEDSAGTWTLTICDIRPSADDGAYYRSRLVLKPRDTAARSGDWSYTVSGAGELDYVEQNIAIYGVDLVGNRSIHPLSLSFTVDNVAPVITVTTSVDTVPITATETVVLAGTASDGGPMNVIIHVQAPEGDLESDREGSSSGVEYRLYLPLVVQGNQTRYKRLLRKEDQGKTSLEYLSQDEQAIIWQYTLTPEQAGRYTLWVNAVDEAGNITTEGPFEIDVVAPTERLTYLPLVVRNGSTR